MIRIFLCVFLSAFCYTSAWAAFDHCGSTAKALSLGNASIAMTDEPSVVLTNPGALGFLQQKGFQASLSRLFDLDELSEKELYFAFPFRSLSIGGGWYSFGKSDYYQENVLSFAFAYKVKERLSLGSNLKYMRVSFSSGYNALSAFSIDLGSTYKVNHKVQLSFVARNLNQPKLVRHSNDIPALFVFGIAVFPLSEVTLLFDLSYEERYKEQLHLGQEIKLVKNLPLRFGIQTSPARYALGVGFNLDRLKLDYAYFNHSALGNTHKFSLLFLWGRKTPEQSPGNNKEFK
jgi:hypothetical protein